MSRHFVGKIIIATYRELLRDIARRSIKILKFKS